MTDPVVVTDPVVEDPKPKPDAVAFTPEQEAEINRRMAATRKQAEADAKRKLEEQQAQKEQQTKEQRDREEAEKRGEFEKVKADLDGKLQSVSTERDELLAKVQQYEDRDKARLEAALKDLPDDLKATDPVNFDPDASLAVRLKWLDVQQATAAKRTTDPTPGNGRPPRPADGQDPKADEEARERQARQTVSRF